MTSISPAATSTVANTTQDSGAQSGDMLAAMRPAMDTAFAVGRPTDAAGAATILGTGGSYVQGATATLGKLDEGIAKRTKELEQLRLTDPDAAKEKQGQLDMLQRLRDRIQLSIERVSDILAGKDRDDIGGPDPAEGSGDAKRRRSRDDDEARRREQLDMLEQRRQLLAPVTPATNVAAADPAAAANTYAAAARSA
jgi:hypothetical protein